MTFAPADFSLQSVLVESPADVDQQSSWTGVDSTAEDHVTHALRHVDAEPQDHTHQQACSEERRRRQVNNVYKDKNAKRNEKPVYEKSSEVAAK